MPKNDSKYYVLIATSRRHVVFDYGGEGGGVLMILHCRSHMTIGLVSLQIRTEHSGLSPIRLAINFQARNAVIGLASCMEG